jgi:hypothetical protein
MSRCMPSAVSGSPLLEEHVEQDRPEGHHLGHEHMELIRCPGRLRRLTVRTCQHHLATPLT